MAKDAQRASLPVSLTNFVGRGRELGLVSQRLASSRLVTLLGPGGIGKTRLAVEAARVWADTHPADAWFVDLTAASDVLSVDRAVVAALEISDDGKADLNEQVLRYLRQGSELIVFDNCEHVIDAAAAYVDRLLRNCADVRVIATSREALAIDGETVIDVPPLEIATEALALFESRAGAVTDIAQQATAAQMRRICEQLDGLPLAIELAAARTRALSLAEIEARLGDRFGLLASGSRSAPDRHKTLGAAVDWSYRLLSDKESALYERLSVFADGFTLQAAETTCCGEGIGLSEVVDLLSHLVDRSLVQRDAGAEPARYRMLETMREHAASKLRDPETWARRHFEWLLGLALEAEPAFRGPGKVQWLDYFSRERANLRAALRWAADRPGLEEDRLCLATALVPLWWFRGPLSEGEDWLRTFLAGIDEVPSPAKTRARIGLGTLRHSVGDLPGALAEFEHAVREARTCGDASLLAQALVWLGGVLAFQRKTVRVHEVVKEAAALLTQHGDDHDRARLALTCIWAWPAIERDWQADLALLRRVGDTSMTGTFLNSLGEIAREQGDIEAAQRYYHEAIASDEAVGGRTGGRVAAAWLNLAVIALMDSDAVTAVPLLQMAMRNANDGQAFIGLSGCLLGTSLCAVLLHQPALGARLLGAMNPLNEAIGFTLSRPDEECRARARSLAIQQLGHVEFDRQFNAGALATLETVVGEAIEFLSREAQVQQRDDGAPRRPGGLSRQEVEVLRLLASGHTNREIAGQLVLSVRTIENHVANTYAKIGARGRSDATAWAIAHRLVNPDHSAAPE